MSRKDREYALLLHNEQMAASRAAAQEQAAIERERIAVERDTVAAQREATKAQDRVSITLEEYLEMREKIAALEREKEIADRIFARIHLPQRMLQMIDPTTVKVNSFRNPEKEGFVIGITFVAHPADELEKRLLENVRFTP